MARGRQASIVFGLGGANLKNFRSAFKAEHCQRVSLSRDLVRRSAQERQDGRADGSFATPSIQVRKMAHDRGLDIRGAYETNDYRGSG